MAQGCDPEQTVSNAFLSLVWQETHDAVDDDEDNDHNDEDNDHNDEDNDHNDEDNDHNDDNVLLFYRSMEKSLRYPPWSSCIRL